MENRFLLVGGADSPWAQVLARAVVEWGGVSLVREAEAVAAAGEAPYLMVVIDAGAAGDPAGLTTLLRKQRPGVPVVVVTASPTWQRARQALQAGAADYIRKSWDEQEIRAAIGALLGRSDSP